MAMDEINAIDTINTTENLEIDATQGLVSIGQWYWVKDKEYDTKQGKKVEYEWFGCVTAIGSNYIELTSPKGERLGYSQKRVHFNNFQAVLRFEPNHEEVIRSRINHYKAITNELMAEVKAITARLGVSTQHSISDQPTSQNTALAVLSGQQDVKAYELALIKASKEDLPRLFEEMKKSNSEVARWMSAESLQLEATVSEMQGSLKEIQSRIFNVSLYAGLAENITYCHQNEDAKPAAFHEKLHVMQRRLYMDEECLLNYRTGGMEFKNIDEFNAWLLEPENLNRILPFQRCMVAMRVRREEKFRESEGSISKAYINIQLRQEDKYTFLYIRNGEQLFCLASEIDFGEMIFPDESMFNPDEPLMVKMFARKPEKFMSVREYEYLHTQYHAKKALYDQWEIENPDKKSSSYRANPNNPYRDYEDYKIDFFDCIEITSLFAMYSIKFREDIC